MTTEIVKFESLSKVAASNIPEIEKSTSAAIAALQDIKVIENDNDFDKAGKFLVKVKNTFTKVEGLRKEITGSLDEIKKELMKSEKKISPNDKNSEYYRVKSLRDAYVRKKQEEANKKQREIELNRLKADQAIKYESDLKESLLKLVANNLHIGDKALISFKEKLTLENWDEKVRLLNYKPKLKSGLVEEALNSVSIPQHVLEPENILKSVWNNHCEQTVKSYESAALQKLEDFKQTLPNYKEMLKRGEKIDADKARRLAEEEARKEAERIESEQAEKRNEESLEVSFEAQVSSQKIDDVSGVRRSKYVRIEDQDKLAFATTLMHTIIHCISDPKFKGIYDGDKVDDQGNRKYVTGVQFWLNHMSKTKESFDIKGLTVEEIVTSIAKS